MDRSVLSEFEEFLLVDLRRAPSTVKQRLLAVRWFLDHSGGLVSPESIRSYLKRFLDKSPRTYADQVKALRLFIRDFLGSKLGYNGSWIESFKLPANAPKPKKLPAWSQVKTFYLTLASKPKSGLKYGALFLLLLSSGMRPEEARSLIIEQVDLERRMVLPRHHNPGGTKRSWVTFFSSEAAEALKAWLKVKPPGPQVFKLNRANMAKAFRRASAQTGVKIHPHLLRSIFAERLSLAGVPDRYIDALCGRTPRTELERHYSDYSPENLWRYYRRAEPYLTLGLRL